MREPSLRRRWIGAVAVILLILAVWTFIEWRTQPPPPTNSPPLVPR